jgi:hypothetical protein
MAQPDGFAEEATRPGAEFFENKVRPLLVKRCYQCHGQGKVKGGLALTSREEVLEGGDSGPAAVVGRPDKSLLIRAVRYQESPRMPPHGKLPDQEIALLTRWVQMGLPWPKGGSQRSAPTIKGGTFRITDAQKHFWSFQPVKPVPGPAVQDASWPRTDIDRFILAALERQGIPPAKAADKRTLLRRATFDLTGLPPTPEETEAFLGDHSPAAFGKVVDRLLASPRYGERWGRHWLDVVRYADARDLIQLPPESDFREAWRYRDWVVAAFNRDLPYTDFLRYQIAGDLTQPRDPSRINADGLIATGMLVIADFVPGDVDKEMMIADCVNDQIDVVGRAFLGLTLACARCHDHKFDPISTEDYYALAGIFFSTRVIPAPLPGNTPLVRVPLWPPAAIAKAKARFAADNRRRAELEQLLAGAAEREYLAYVKRLVRGQTGRYFLAACDYNQRARDGATISLGALARQYHLSEDVLAGWVDYLGKWRPKVLAGLGKELAQAAAGNLDRAALERSVRHLEEALTAAAARKKRIAAKSPLQQALANALVLHLRADDPHLLTDAQGHATLWPDRADGLADAAPVSHTPGPVKATAKINGRARPVLRFDGKALLEARRTVPPVGSLLVVCRVSGAGTAGQRLLGWEDSSVGRHGLGLMLGPSGGWHAILRNIGQAGDVVHPRKAAAGFEIVSLTWGERGVVLHRDRKAAGANQGIRSVSSDPAIVALRIGGPGSGGSPRFCGDLAELRVYNQQLDDKAQAAVEAELFERWFTDKEEKAAPADPLIELYDEFCSPRGPFWAKTGDKAKLLPPQVQARLAVLRTELATLKQKKPPEVPLAVAVQDGGPKGSKHEGFQDAHVYIRGDPKRPGKKVARGFPKILAGGLCEPIKQGSGRLQLARWLSREDHPLTARVMVNRIWQHHFGEGIVRTSNNFGQRGDRPTHPELLDYLSNRFVKSGWSVKAIHRLIMRSAVYQQSTRGSPAGRAKDPENRLLSRMNRRRLEAEAIRDSLLAVAGRLNATPGGPAFKDLALPRRTLYLMSVRTGANTSGFAALFDRPDPGAIVEKRSVSTVAPQALFFLNDPFVMDQARALAERIAREVPANRGTDRIRRLYAIVFGRPPTRAEVEVGRQLLKAEKDIDPWQRYCHLMLCTNEFLYVD